MIDRQEAEKVPEPIIEDYFRNLEPFKRRRHEKCARIIEPFTQYATGLVKRVGFEKAGVEELRKLAEDLLSAEPEIISTEIESPITAEFLASQLKPWIEDIRQRLFHSKSAPFCSVSHAKKWLDEVNKRRDEWHKRVDEWNKRVDEWHKRVDEWNNCRQAILEKYPHITGGIEKWSLMKKQGIEVEFPPQDECQRLNEIQHTEESLKLKIGNPPEQGEEVKTYWALIDAMFEIDKVTGFTWKSLEMYILMDALPVLPAFTVGIVRETHSLPSGTSLQNRFASVTIRGDLTFQDLRSLYRSIRRELGIKRSKRLTKKHLQLYEMVKKKGSIPDRVGTVAFWKSVMKEWNALHRKDKYKTWKGVKLAYERIIAQVERRMTKVGGYNER